MKDKRTLSCLTLAAALCAPLAVAAGPASAAASTSMVALDVKAMSDEALQARMGEIKEALGGGDARVIRRALAGVSNSGMAVSDEQVQTIAASLKELASKHADHAELIKQELFKVENLTIGRIAPNIKGQDTEGVKFELTDYRGKVVVIDFWGDW